MSRSEPSVSVETASNRRRFATIATASFGVALALAVAWGIHASDSRRAADEFDRRVLRESAALERGLGASFENVSAVAALFESSPDVTREQFALFASDATARHETLAALEWIPRVPDGRRAAYESAARADGLAAFEIRERNFDGELMRASQRPEYYPVYYVEPLAGNEGAVGFDLASSAPRRAMLESASDADELRISGRILLVQGGADEVGFLAALPVFDAASTLQGYALGVFRAGRVVRESLAELGDTLHVRVVDITADSASEGGDELFVSEGRPGSGSDLESVESIVVGGRTWQVEYRPGSAYRAPASAIPPWLAFLAIVAGTLLLTGLVRRDALHGQEMQRVALELQDALTELKHAEGELASAAKMASLGQLTAGVAHEINNPVNYILAGSRSLNRNLDEIIENVDGFRSADTLEALERAKSAVDDETIDETRELLGAVAEGAERTAEIVRGLRTFSRLDEDTLKAFDLHEGLQSTFVILRSRMKGRIELVQDFGEVPELTGYPGQINQVFMNLLGNAIGAIDGEGTITVSTAAANGTVTVSIRDTGRGMSADVQQRIFEPFFTTKDVGEGTGLGLSISHGIVSAHGGAIEVESAPGEGTTMSVTLPVSGPSS